MTFRVRGETLHGRLYGSGRNGVVLADESDLDQRSWSAFARTLARKGDLVLSFDYGSELPEEEVTAAAAALRRAGAGSIALVGASEGAKAAIMAAAVKPPAFAAVVSLSAERYAQRRDVLPYARRLTVPTLFLTARGDPVSARDTQLLERAAASPEKPLQTVPGEAHGSRCSRAPKSARRSSPSSRDTSRSGCSRSGSWARRPDAPQAAARS